MRTIRGGLWKFIGFFTIGILLMHEGASIPTFSSSLNIAPPSGVGTGYQVLSHGDPRSGSAPLNSPHFELINDQLGKLLSRLSASETPEDIETLEHQRVGMGARMATLDMSKEDQARCAMLTIGLLTILAQNDRYGSEGKQTLLKIVLDPQVNPLAKYHIAGNILTKWSDWQSDSALAASIRAVIGTVEREIKYPTTTVEKKCQALKFLLEVLTKGGSDHFAKKTTHRLLLELVNLTVGFSGVRTKESGSRNEPLLDKIMEVFRMEALTGDSIKTLFYLNEIIISPRTNWDVRGVAIDTLKWITEEAYRQARNGREREKIDIRDTALRYIIRVTCNDRGEEAYYFPIVGSLFRDENLTLEGKIQKLETIDGNPETQPLTYLILEGLDNDIEFLKTAILDHLLNIKTRLYALGLIVSRYNSMEYLSYFEIDKISTFLKDLMKLPQKTVLQIFFSPMIREELKIYTIAIILKVAADPEIPIFTDPTMILQYIKQVMEKTRISYGWNNTNSDLKIGSESIQRGNMREVVLTQAHECGHNFLRYGLKFLPDSLNKKSIHEIMSDWLMKIVGNWFGIWTSTDDDRLGFRKHSIDVLERGGWALEEHEAARAQQRRIEGVIFSDFRYRPPGGEGYYAKILFRYGMELLASDGTTDFYEFIRKILIRYSREVLNQTHRDDSIGRNYPPKPQRLVDPNSHPIVPWKTIIEIFGGNRKIRNRAELKTQCAI